MSHIIQLHGDPHRQTQELLPWYADGTLEPDEHALVEAHIAECADCRADLESDRSLRLQIADMSTGLERGWAAMREKIDAAPQQRPARAVPFLRRPIAVGWALAAQLVAATLILAMMLPASRPTAEPAYHVLGSDPTAVSGNIIVLFKPDTTEGDMRAALVQTNARLVDGPTASGAYVLHVPEGNRPAVLERLRGISHILLAEPVDAGGKP